MPGGDPGAMGDHDEREIADKVVVVTGGNSGIGLATAKAFGAKEPGWPSPRAVTPP